MIQYLAFAFVLTVTSTSYAHDEGHGPKLTDSAKQGGVLSPVIKKADAKKGSAAAVVHKAELVRTSDGTVRVYLYNQKMEPLALDNVDKTAKGVLEFKKNKKWQHLPFTLALEGDAFVGKSPKVAAKPFNIDVHLKQGSEELLTAFDNLD